MDGGYPVSGVDGAGEWVLRGPLDSPTVQFVCIEALRVEGGDGAEGQEGYDMMEFMVVDPTTDPEGKAISHMFRMNVGLAGALSYAIQAWIDEDAPEWQQGRRHIHVETQPWDEDNPNVAGQAIAYWVPPNEDEKGHEHGG